MKGDDSERHADDRDEAADVCDHLKGHFVGVGQLHHQNNTRSEYISRDSPVDISIFPLSIHRSLRKGASESQSLENILGDAKHDISYVPTDCIFVSNVSLFTTVSPSPL